MEQSVSTIARNVVENLRNSFFQGRGGYYERMDQDSDSEEDNTISDSLFYSANQVNEDSIPLTLSNNYSDRSQLLYDQTDSDGIDHSTSSDYEENPVNIFTNDLFLGWSNNLIYVETLCYILESTRTAVFKSKIVIRKFIT